MSNILTNNNNVSWANPILIAIIFNLLLFSILLSMYRHFRQSKKRPKIDEYDMKENKETVKNQNEEKQIKIREEEIEKKKKAKIRTVKIEPEEDEFELMTIWPQLTKVLNWLLRNKFDKALEVLNIVLKRRQYELDQERRRIAVQKEMMLEQVENRHHAKIKSVLVEVCCGENSKLSNTFKEKGGEAIRIFLPQHDMSKRVTLKALTQTIEELQSEKFNVKIWVSIPCSPWCSWQRVNAKTVPGFEE